MKFRYNGHPEDNNHLCFEGCDEPLYKMWAKGIDPMANERPAVKPVDERMSWPLDELELTNRARNVLLRNGVLTIGELVALTPMQLGKFRSAGAGVVRNVMDALAQLDLSLAEDKTEDEPRHYTKQSQQHVVANEDGSYEIIKGE